jgi:hypothetical protein
MPTRGVKVTPTTRTHWGSGDRRGGETDRMPVQELHARLLSRVTAHRKESSQVMTDSPPLSRTLPSHQHEVIGRDQGVITCIHDGTVDKGGAISERIDRKVRHPGKHRYGEYRRVAEEFANQGESRARHSIGWHDLVAWAHAGRRNESCPASLICTFIVLAAGRADIQIRGFAFKCPARWIKHTAIARTIHPCWINGSPRRSRKWPFSETSPSQSPYTA